MNEIMKRKYKELELFNGYTINLLDKEIYFFVKPLTIKQRDFIKDNIKDILNSKEQTIYFFMQLAEIKEEELELILDDEIASQNFLKIVFSDADINLNFCNLVIERFELFNKHSNDLFFIFNSILVNRYNYKMLELEDLPFMKIVDLCIKESSARNDSILIDILESQCDGVMKKYSNEKDKFIYKEYEKLSEYIKTNLSKKKTSSKKEKSQFDLLGEL